MQCDEVTRACTTKRCSYFSQGLSYGIALVTYLISSMRGGIRSIVMIREFHI